MGELAVNTPTDMVFVGRCPSCHAVIGAYLERDYDRTAEVRDMLNRGLVVERIANDPPVVLQGCNHTKTEAPHE